MKSENGQTDEVLLLLQPSKTAVHAEVRARGLTYTGLLKGDGGGSFAQGVDCGHVDFVGGGGEDLGETDVTAVLVVWILLHVQRVLVVSVDVSKGGTSP